MGNLRMFNFLRRKPKISIPTIDRVSEEIQGYRLDHQGPTIHYRFFSNSKCIGSVKTELWKEDNLLLVHDIRASATGIRNGTAMVSWLVANSSEMIQPVHVIHNGLGFWIKLKKIWPSRIIDLDLRCSEYWDLLENRKDI
ncbi:hypothetical protein G3496_19270 [Shewanella baltica]|nr:hypothetical protein [Shewanella baltica]